MRKILILSLFALSNWSWGQNETLFSVDNWSDSTAFYSVESVLADGLGEFSSMLSEENGGKIFFEVNGEYFVINNAADYFLWYTKKNPHLFSKSREKYLIAYLNNDDASMIHFLSRRFNGKILPLTVDLNSWVYGRGINNSGRWTQNNQEIYSEFYHPNNPNNSHVILRETTLQGARRPTTTKGQ
jgi:hypothetical protein